MEREEAAGGAVEVSAKIEAEGVVGGEDNMNAVCMKFQQYVGKYLNGYF